MKKYVIFFFLVISMFAVSAQAAPTGNQMADQILGGAKNGNSAVSAPVTSDNYLLKQEKLAEQMGLIARKQSGFEKKISAKVDKKYVDVAVKAVYTDIDTRIATINSDVDAKIKAINEGVDKKIKIVNADADTKISAVKAISDNADSNAAWAFKLVILAILLALGGLFWTWKKK